MSGSLKYAENERVFCFHGPCMYEAKVLKAEVWEESAHPGQIGPHFLVHYKGWKVSWDEWVEEDRLRKFTDENVKVQKTLVEEQIARDRAEREATRAVEAAEAAAKREASQAAATGATTSATATSAAPAPTAAGAAPRSSIGSTGGAKVEDKRGMKRGREGEGEEEFQLRPEVKISIPDSLKTQLVDDWEAITKNHTLVPLPRYPDIDTILEEWIKYLQNEDLDRRRLAKEVSQGLGIYFEKALGHNLLYRFERGQYATILKEHGGEEDFKLTSVYGCEHLLRLFVNLPELLSQAKMDFESVSVLKENMAQFLCWLDLNKKILFTKTYETTSSGYQNNNRA